MEKRITIQGENRLSSVGQKESLRNNRHGQNRQKTEKRPPIRLDAAAQEQAVLSIVKKTWIWCHGLRRNGVMANFLYEKIKEMGIPVSIIDKMVKGGKLIKDNVPGRKGYVYPVFIVPEAGKQVSKI